MSTLHRSFLYGLVFLPALGAAVPLCFEKMPDASPGGAREAGPLTAEARRGARLEAQLAQLQKRQATKRRVGAALRAQRITLFEAAARFHDLDLQDRKPDRYTAFLRASYRGHSDGERLCRRVIEYVGAMEADPARARKIVKGLEANLEAHLARNGTIQLPRAH